MISVSSIAAGGSLMPLPWLRRVRDGRLVDLPTVPTSPVLPSRWTRSRRGQPKSASKCSPRPEGSVKYRKLLRTISVEEDCATYGDYFDYGRWSGTEHNGNKDLPPGYWV